jgi:hypothetical protein
MVQVDVQQRRAGGSHATAQRRLDQIDVIETSGAMQIDNQMHAGATHAIAIGEMIVTLVIDDRLDDRDLGNLRVFLSGGAWIPQALIRS